MEEAVKGDLVNDAETGKRFNRMRKRYLKVEKQCFPTLGMTSLARADSRFKSFNFPSGV
jgi:hypothetical protein